MEDKKLKTLGRHLLVEYFGCDKKILNNLELIKRYMDEAAIKSGATIVDNVFHLFNPHGISGVVVIAESHLTIHTWPEYGYAAVDLFTCGETVDPWKAFDFLKTKLRASKSATVEMKRGHIGKIIKELSPTHLTGEKAPKIQVPVVAASN